MSNPLLQEYQQPPFSELKLEHFVPAISELIEKNREQINALIEASNQSLNWDAMILPLQEVSEKLGQAWSLLSHYNSVLNSDELRPIYEELLAKMTAFGSEVSLNSDLYEAYRKLFDSAHFNELSESQQASIKHVIQDFELSGVALPEDQKAEYAEYSQRLSQLQNQFSQNVLDATQLWGKLIASKDELAGVPESALGMYARAAKEQGHESGYWLTLDIPSYLPIVTYCENRALRQELYMAYMTRASDQGPNAGEWDNSPIIEEILSLRQRMSKMLGFEHYAERSVASKMAESSEAVIGFLNDLAQRSKPKAQEEFEELSAFAKQQGGPQELEMWDLPFYSEKLKQAQFGFSKEALRPYFPADKVLSGMFDVAQRLFDIEIRANNQVSLPHEDTLYFEILREGEVQAGFYADLYARKNKRGGAWLASCRSRYRKIDGSLQKPMAFLVCNFTPPDGEQPSLLTPEEVTTLFHEFGHCLHYTLTQVDVANVAGIRNVAWDAVELPSQMMENWCWQDDVLPLISGHYQTGEAIDTGLVDKLKAAQKFQGALMMVRQLEFALFDFILHCEFTPGESDMLATLDRIRDQVSVKKPPAETRFSHGFSHIFAGGYSAGYYSYKWAEVLSADAFSRFEEEGLFNAQTGNSFRKEFLELGGSRDVMDMFVAFRGRKPSVEPLLKQAGIV